MQCGRNSNEIKPKKLFCELGLGHIVKICNDNDSIDTGFFNRMRQPWLLILIYTQFMEKKLKKLKEGKKYMVVAHNT